MSEIGHNSDEFERACEVIDGLTDVQRKELLGIRPIGRSEHGGRTGTVRALRRKGVYKQQWTPELTSFGELVVSVLREMDR